MAKTTTRSAKRPAKPSAEVVRDTYLLDIAQRLLGLETLDQRHSDGLDFKEQAVWSVKAALEAAYEAGKRAHLTENL